MEVVVRCQVGEREAFGELVGQWHGVVWGYVRGMVGRDEVADDVAQEVWVAVVRGLPRLREPAGFAGWLFTIARRAVMNHLRDRYAGPAVEGAWAHTAEEPAGEDLAEQVIRRTDLVRWLAEVPLVEREVLVLFHLEEMSLEECAQVLGVPVGTVKSRLFRARRMVREVSGR